MTESYKLSYCLDINVGYDRTYRERLIDFLREVGKDFTVTTVERGHFCGMYQLRIATTKAHELQAHIYEIDRMGDDYDYAIHYFEIDAQHDMNFLPEYRAPEGYEPFALT